MAQARTKRPPERDETTVPPYSMRLDWDPDDEIFVVTVPELPGCQTHGKTYDKAVKKGQAAIRSWLHAADHWETPIPPPQVVRHLLEDSAPVVAQPAPASLSPEALQDFARHLSEAMRFRPDIENMPATVTIEMLSIVDALRGLSYEQSMAYVANLLVTAELPPTTLRWIYEQSLRVLVVYFKMRSPDISSSLEALVKATQVVGKE